MLGSFDGFHNPAVLKHISSLLMKMKVTMNEGAAA
jgi:hypothetical protein